MVDYIPFCDKWTEELWDRRTAAEQETYIVSELKRLAEEGRPILRAVLACPEEWPQFVALKLLQTGVDSLGNEVVTMPQVFLRLVDPERVPATDPDTGETIKAGAIPPPRDPQGRPLPADKLGKVLVVKTGNLGGQLDPHTDAVTARAFGGDKRLVNAKAGRPLYLTREVAREPRPFTFRDAVLILRQWGYGVGDTAFRSPRSPDKHGKRERGQCLWLVEEVSPEDAMRELAKHQAAKRKAAE